MSRSNVKGLATQTSGARPKGAVPLVYVNGQVLAENEATVSVFDSGLNFADGVFEGIRVYAGRVFRLEEHVRRLFRSARVFDIDIGLTPDRLIDEIITWLRVTGERDGFHFRPIVTRGRRFPPRLDPRNCQDRATLLFVGGSIGSAPTRPIRVIVSSMRRPGPDVLDPRVKSLNYGNNLLARMEALRRGVDDAIMLDTSGMIAEASAANVFLVSEERVLTPWPKACLAGITRQAVLELAHDEGIPTEERDLTVTDLINADEVFLTGTGAEITPVGEVDGRVIPGQLAGSITSRLAARYAKLVRNEGVAIGG